MGKLYKNRRREGSTFTGWSRVGFRLPTLRSVNRGGWAVGEMVIQVPSSFDMPRFHLPPKGHQELAPRRLVMGVAEQLTKQKHKESFNWNIRTLL